MEYYQRGIAALVTVVIIGASVLFMATGAAFLGFWEADSSFIENEGKRALAVAEACLEDTLVRLRRDPNYNGGAPPTFSSGSCSASVAGGGSIRLVDAVGYVGKHRKLIRADITLGGVTVTITGWTEFSI